MQCSVSDGGVCGSGRGRLFIGLLFYDLSNNYLNPRYLVHNGIPHDSIIHANQGLKCALEFEAHRIIASLQGFSIRNMFRIGLPTVSC